MPAIALLLAGASPASAQAGEAWRAPTLTHTRYDEDWSKLADPAARNGHWSEALKYIPLDTAGDAWLTTGIEIRLRSESNRDALWGAADALVGRLRGGTGHVTVLVSIIFSSMTGSAVKPRPRSTSAASATDVAGRRRARSPSTRASSSVARSATNAATCARRPSG